MSAEIHAIIENRYFGYTLIVGLKYGYWGTVLIKAIAGRAARVPAYTAAFLLGCERDILK